MRDKGGSHKINKHTTLEHHIILLSDQKLLISYSDIINLYPLILMFLFQIEKKEEKGIRKETRTMWGLKKTNLIYQIIAIIIIKNGEATKWSDWRHSTFI